MIPNIPSIEIITFAYLINKRYKAVNPTNAIPDNNPLTLYLNVNNNIQDNITTAIIIFAIFKFWSVILEYINSL